MKVSNSVIGINIFLLTKRKIIQENVIWKNSLMGQGSSKQSLDKNDFKYDVKCDGLA